MGISAATVMSLCYPLNPRTRVTSDPSRRYAHSSLSSLAVRCHKWFIFTWQSWVFKIEIPPALQALLHHPRCISDTIKCPSSADIFQGWLAGCKVQKGDGACTPRAYVSQGSLWHNDLPAERFIIFYRSFWRPASTVACRSIIKGDWKDGFKTLCPLNCIL